MNSRRASLACAVLIFSAPPFLCEEPAELSLELLFHPDSRISTEGRSLSEFVWLERGATYLERRPANDPKGERIVQTDVRSGRFRDVLTVEELAGAFAAAPGFRQGDSDRLASSIVGSLLATEQSPGRAGKFRLNPSRDSILINHDEDLFLYRIGDGTVRRLTHGPEPEVGEEFSPDGGFVSFIRGHDLFIVHLASGDERPLTDEGREELLYGRLDWVYQEELYGRGNFKGYWWSPDSSRIALLRLDESSVHEFTVVDHIPTRLKTEISNYPKAGDPNPEVALGVIRVAGGPIQWIDTSRYAPFEHLIVRVSWAPDGESLLYQIQDREQTWLDLNSVSMDEPVPRTLFRETSPAFVEVSDNPVWLDDGTFLWTSERTGYRHLYHHKADGSLVRAVTDGEWEVRRLHGVDQQGRWIYFSGMKDSPVEEHVYRTALGGGQPKRVSALSGTHSVLFDPTFRHYLNRWSDVRTPPKLSLHAADGELLRTIDRNDVPELERVTLGEIRFFKVPARDGFVMEAMMITPPDFDESKKYPVIQFNYGGPQAPVVRNRWGGPSMLWNLLLAQKGYIVWMCDNRSASGKGVKPAWEIYGQMGFVELRDMEDGLTWLKKKPYVDGSRIGIWGWSYGGYMTLFALTHSESFKMGIAGAPVTDWRLYDSIYTERFMKRPQNNPEGYEKSSLLRVAKNLKGRLLLIHGTMDDNVHMQNSIQLIYELQKAGKEFDLMIYPKSRHRVREPMLNFHMNRLMTRFVVENL